MSTISLMKGTLSTTFLMERENNTLPKVPLNRILCFLLTPSCLRWYTAVQKVLSNLHGNDTETIKNPQKKPHKSIIILQRRIPETLEADKQNRAIVPITMAEPPDTIFEEREEVMISPTNDVVPTLRNAHFLKPTVTSIDEPIPKLRSPSTAYTTHFEVGQWPLNVYFNGWRNPQRKWKAWVNSLRATYESTWKKVGIYEAILNSTCEIRRNDDSVLAIAEKWCSKTKSFIFPWGEATITLEDMMALGGFPVLGDSVLSHLETEEMVQIEEYHIEARTEAGRSAARSATQDVWIKLFYGSGGNEFEHEAFLVLWLSRFIFPNGSKLIRKQVFPIAVRLARGIRIALAPAVLANIYRDFTMLKETIVASTRLDLSNDHDEVLELNLRAPFQLVQIWVWERFLELRPEPNLIEFGEPRFSRWDKAKKLKTNDLRLALDSAGDSFLWRPYVKALNNGGNHNFYGDREKSMSLDLVLVEEVLSFARCIRLSELVGLDCIQQYLPHRVAMQFGIDQDVPGCVARYNKSPEIAWSYYSRPISDVKLHIPSRLFESDVTTRYLEWWKKSYFGCQDAIKSTVVRKRRSARVSKTLERSVQSSNGMKGDMGAYLPPAFHSNNKRLGAGISSNKYDISTGTRQDDENQQHSRMVDFQYVDIKDIPPPPGFPPKFRSVKVEKSCYEHNNFQGPIMSVPPGFPPKFSGVDGMISRASCSRLKNRQDGETQHSQMADSQRLLSSFVDIKPLMSSQSEYLCDEAVSKMESFINPGEKTIMHGEAVNTGSEEAMEDGNASGEFISAQNAASINDNVGKSSSHFALEVTALELEARISKLERVFAARKIAKFSNGLEKIIPK